MSLHSVLVTGANRGIGLELVRQLCAWGSSKVSYIIATARKPEEATALNELAKHNENLTILQLDVKNYARYDEFYNQVAEIVGDKGLNWLINNAGMLIRANFDDVTPQQMLENIEVNAITPLILSRKLLPLLKLSASQNKLRTQIIQMSSKIASIEDNKSGGTYPYRASKTALNQISKSMSVDLLPHKIHTSIIHPGWVQTDMGGPNALITTQQSASSMLAFLSDESKELNGKFLNYDGTPIPW